MKVKLEDLSFRLLGLPCLFSWSSTNKGIVGHSQRDGLMSGEVSDAPILLGRLTGVAVEKLHFTTCYIRTHPVNLSWSLGPRFDEVAEYELSTKYVNRHSIFYIGANSVRQHLMFQDRPGGIWLLWPCFRGHLSKLVQKK